MTEPQAVYLGPYQLLEQVAQGAYGEVYRALHVGQAGFQRVLAIKRLKRHVMEDEAAIQAFKIEARIGGLLIHHNIAQVMEFGQHDGHYYLAMEYVEGLSLLDILTHHRKTDTPIPPPVALEIIAQACDGLHFAHEAQDNSGVTLNLVHRDIKPSNLMLTRTGVVKVMDFGIARVDNMALTDAGFIKGTPRYLSPEVISRSEGVDRRSDIFSLATVLYELLTLKVLFDAPNLLSLMAKVREADVAPALKELPRGLKPVIKPLAKALSAQPTGRFQTAKEMARELRQVRRELSSEELDLDAYASEVWKANPPQPVPVTPRSIQRDVPRPTLGGAEGARAPLPAEPPAPVRPPPAEPAPVAPNPWTSPPPPAEPENTEFDPGARRRGGRVSERPLILPEVHLRTRSLNLEELAATFDPRRPPTPQAGPARPPLPPLAVESLVGGPSPQAFTAPPVAPPPAQAHVAPVPPPVAAPPAQAYSAPVPPPVAAPPAQAYSAPVPPPVAAPPAQAHVAPVPPPVAAPPAQAHVAPVPPPVAAPPAQAYVAPVPPPVAPPPAQAHVAPVSPPVAAPPAQAYSAPVPPPVAPPPAQAYVAPVPPPVAPPPAQAYSAPVPPPVAAPPAQAYSAPVPPPVAAASAAPSARPTPARLQFSIDMDVSFAQAVQQKRPEAATSQEAAPSAPEPVRVPSSQPSLSAPSRERPSQERRSPPPHDEAFPGPTVRMQVPPKATPAPHSMEPGGAQRVSASPAPVQPPPLSVATAAPQAPRPSGKEPDPWLPSGDQDVIATRMIDLRSMQQQALRERSIEVPLASAPQPPPPSPSEAVSAPVASPGPALPAPGEPAESENQDIEDPPTRVGRHAAQRTNVVDVWQGAPEARPMEGMAGEPELSETMAATAVAPAHLRSMEPLKPLVVSTDLDTELGSKVPLAGARKDSPGALAAARLSSRAAPAAPEPERTMARGPESLGPVILPGLEVPRGPQRGAEGVPVSPHLSGVVLEPTSMEAVPAEHTAVSLEEPTSMEPVPPELVRERLVFESTAAGPPAFLEAAPLEATAADPVGMGMSWGEQPVESLGNSAGSGMPRGMTAAPNLAGGRARPELTAAVEKTSAPFSGSSWDIPASQEYPPTASSDMPLNAPPAPAAPASLWGTPPQAPPGAPLQATGQPAPFLGGAPSSSAHPGMPQAVGGQAPYHPSPLHPAGSPTPAPARAPEYPFSAGPQAVPQASPYPGPSSPTPPVDPFADMPSRSQAQATQLIIVPPQTAPLPGGDMPRRSPPPKTQVFVPPTGNPLAEMSGQYNPDDDVVHKQRRVMIYAAVAGAVLLLIILIALTR